MDRLSHFCWFIQSVEKCPTITPQLFKVNTLRATIMSNNFYLTFQLMNKNTLWLISHILYECAEWAPVVLHNMPFTLLVKWLRKNTGHNTFHAVPPTDGGNGPRNTIMHPAKAVKKKTARKHGNEQSKCFWKLALQVFYEENKKINTLFRTDPEHT